MLSPEQLERADSEVIVVSDGTGDTATSAVKAVMLQFHSEWKLRVFGGIRHESEVRRVIDQAEGSNALVVFSLVDKRVAGALIREAGSRGVPTVDLLGALIAKVAQHLHAEPLNLQCGTTMGRASKLFLKPTSCWLGCRERRRRPFRCISLSAGSRPATCPWYLGLSPRPYSVKLIRGGSSV
jgi:hypothetical protein